MFIIVIMIASHNKFVKKILFEEELWLREKDKTNDPGFIFYTELFQSFETNPMNIFNP